MGASEIGVYKLGRTLGAGTYGKVKWGVNTVTGQEVAVKIMKPQEVKDRSDIEREISILKLLKHPNIVDLYEVIQDNDGRIYLVLELVTGGEMFDYIVTRGKIKEREAKRFFRQMVSAVEYCHGNLIVHRDLKPENLLLDSEGNIKINDFGFSNVIKPGKLFSTFCGSPLYAAPEIFLAKEYIGPEVDIWSMGVILYVLVFGQLPWAVAKDGRVDDLDSLLQAKYEIPKGSDVSQECIDLIAKMMVPKRKARITIEEIRNHPWIQDPTTGPPPCLLPTRAPVVEVSKKILDQMTLIGFDSKVAELQILSNERCTAVSIYHLLLSKDMPPKTAPPKIEPKAIQPDYIPDPAALRPRRSSFYLPSSITPLFTSSPSPLRASGKKQDAPPSPTTAFNPSLSPTLTSHNNNSHNNNNSHSSSLFEPRLRARTLTGDLPKKRFSLPIDMAQPFRAATPPNMPASPSSSTSPSSSPSASPPMKARKNSTRILTGLFKKKKSEELLEKQILSSPERAKSPSPESKSPPLRKLPSLKLSIPRKTDKIRTTKGVFNVDTTTTKMPADIINELTRVLKQNELENVLDGYILQCKQRPATPDKDRKQKQLQFEIEVCQIKGLTMYGVKFKRVAGDVWEYRNMVQALVGQLKL